MGGEVVDAAAELVVAGEFGSLGGEGGVASLGEATAAVFDLGGTRSREVDESGLVKVDESAAFGSTAVDGVQFAVESGQFGG